MVKWAHFTIRSSYIQSRQDQNFVLPPFTLKRLMISNGVNKSLYFMKFFVKCHDKSATAQSKKVFLLQIDPEIGSKTTSRYFLLNKGLKMAFYEIKS